MEQYITYEMFGARGDGVTDDMPAIVKAHAHANAAGLPVQAREGACYYISPADATAVVMTDTDWTGAKFIIDDRGCENRGSVVFKVQSGMEPVELPIASLRRGQTHIDNPTGRDLHVTVINANHADFIRKGLNQNNGRPRMDVFVLYADGRLHSPVVCDFDEVTRVIARPIDAEKLTLRGGEFTTIANQAESRYDYHYRNIQILRSNVDVSGITHLVTGELDHGAPYGGFLCIDGCAFVNVSDCLLTAHTFYYTIGSAGKPVPMGTYDLNCGESVCIRFVRCRQTNDIMDRMLWGIMGSNYCRDLLFEDCVFSRFDAHMGVTDCTLRRCTLGWMCINAIGHGTFTIEDSSVFGRSVVNLRDDYGAHWRGDMVIRNCTWKPLDGAHYIFSATNDGTHDFGYECHLPRSIEIDGLTIEDEPTGDEPLYVFNNYVHSDEPVEGRPYMPVPPARVKVRGVSPARRIELCARADLMPDTEFELK